MHLLLDIKICKFSTQCTFILLYFERIKDIINTNSIFDIIRSISFLKITINSDILVVINKTVYSTAKSVYVER